MQTVLFNDFYMATDHNIGGYNTTQANPTAEQLHNANNIKTFFEGEGWTLQAICGMIANMHGESSLNPALIQATNRYRLPNSAADLSDVPNDVMKNFYKEYYGTSQRAFAIGLVQWDGKNSDNPPAQKLVGYAIRNNFIWYDGWCQCYRLRGEWQQDAQYHFFNPVTVSGVRYTFTNYATSTASPEDLAKAWSWGYERNAGGPGLRPASARWWYNYFSGGVPPAPVDPPDPEDPDEPYDPTHPIGPLPDAPESINIMLLYNFRKWRKGRNVRTRI